MYKRIVFLKQTNAWLIKVDNIDLGNTIFYLKDTFRNIHTINYIKIKYTEILI